MKKTFSMTSLNFKHFKVSQRCVNLVICLVLTFLAFVPTNSLSTMKLSNSSGLINQWEGDSFILSIGDLDMPLLINNDTKIIYPDGSDSSVREFREGIKQLCNEGRSGFIVDVLFDDQATFARKINIKGVATASKEQIFDIQRSLEFIGYNPGPADGIMGGKTINSIIEFKEENQLSANGCISKKFMNIMLKAVEEKERAGSKTLQGRNNIKTEDAETYLKTGNAWFEKGEYDRAIENYNNAVKIYMSAPEPNQPNIAALYIYLGIAYDKKGEYDKSIEYLNKALKISLKEFDSEHPNVATVYANMGEVYNSKGEYDKAFDYYDKALNIYMKKLGADQPHTKFVQDRLNSLKQKM